MSDFLSFYWDAMTDENLFVAMIFWFIALAIILLVGLLLWLVLSAAYRQIVWRINRKHCQHCDTWTTRVAEDYFDGCRRANACCSRCAIDHQAKREDIHPCPICRTPMNKQIHENELVLDVCPQEHVVVLSPDEFMRVQQMNYNRGHSDGKSSGQMSGLAVGMIIG